MVRVRGQVIGVLRSGEWACYFAASLWKPVGWDVACTCAMTATQVGM